MIHNRDLASDSLGGELPCHFCDVLAQVCPYKQRYEALVFGGIPPGAVGDELGLLSPPYEETPHPDPLPQGERELSAAPHPGPLPMNGEREFMEAPLGGGRELEVAPHDYPPPSASSPQGGGSGIHGGWDWWLFWLLALVCILGMVASALWA